MVNGRPQCMVFFPPPENFDHFVEHDVYIQALLRVINPVNGPRHVPPDTNAPSRPSRRSNAMSTQSSISVNRKRSVSAGPSEQDRIRDLESTVQRLEETIAHISRKCACSSSPSHLPARRKTRVAHDARPRSPSLEIIDSVVLVPVDPPPTGLPRERSPSLETVDAPLPIRYPKAHWDLPSAHLLDRKHIVEVKVHLSEASVVTVLLHARRDHTFCIADHKVILGSPNIGLET
ncbi:hypothetical protein FISHEDRAFT_77394, partial [Fistulina hepatica ATCC 64428]